MRSRTYHEREAHHSSKSCEAKNLFISKFCWLDKQEPISYVKSYSYDDDDEGGTVYTPLPFLPQKEF